jgi:glycosyltransferase involved in cell wall biosynthesis
VLSIGQGLKTGNDTSASFSDDLANPIVIISYQGRNWSLFVTIFMTITVNKLITIIIPCYNSAQTIGTCLRAIYRSDYPHYEVIVVDDHSSDASRDIIQKYPCQLISLPKHQGAGFARNAGVRASRGDILFFTDADCVLQKNTLQIVADTMATVDTNVIVGGTYTKRPYDNNFFSRFQSLFIHYAETKHAVSPDYIATHAQAMYARLFKHHEGFTNQVFPILEDVEYSHRLKRDGVKLIINPELQVQHIFNFSFLRSIQNAIRKTRFWTTYSLRNKDLLADSGTASHELKINTLAFALMAILLILFTVTNNNLYIASLIALVTTNIGVNFRFLTSIYRTQGLFFTLAAACYYMFIYPIAVSTGSLLGISSYMKYRYASREAE